MTAEAERPPSERREALIAAAFALIAEKGFEGLRLRDVAAAAGIDHSTLHHHFATKQDLVDAVVGYAVQQFRSGRAADAPPETLHLHLENLARLTRERPQLLVVMRELDLRATRDSAVRTIIERHEEGWRLALARRLQTIGLTGDQLEHTVELVIAAVKGASLRPVSAVDVLGRLESLLTGEEKS